MQHPRLWWPLGQGEQHLYKLEIAWEGANGQVQGESRRIGLRTAELVREPDSSPDGQPGESFFLRINGRPIYAKGANWIPPDQFVERCTPQVYRHLLMSMAEANMNIVRVWGGGWYEQDVFYDLCDELGLMVWQDFMMACGCTLIRNPRSMSSGRKLAIRFGACTPGRASCSGTGTTRTLPRSGSGGEKMPTSIETWKSIRA